MEPSTKPVVPGTLRIRRLRHLAAWHLSAVLALVALACGRGESGESRKTVPSAQAKMDSGAKPKSGSLGAAATPSSGPIVPREKPRTASPERVKAVELLTLPVSAYHARLAIDASAIYVLAPKSAHRVVPGEATKSVELELGEGAVLTRTGIVHWSSGAIRVLPKTMTKPERLATVPHRPQYFVTSGERFAWIDRDEAWHYSIRTLDGGATKVVYAGAGAINNATMIGDWVFFTEEASDASWRFGGVPLRGDRPTFTAKRTERVPATMVADREVYFYEPTNYEVRALSPDFQQERTISRGHVCSPIAVHRNAYCGQVEGLLQISMKTGTPLLLVPSSKLGSVVEVVVNERWAAWTSELGEAALRLSMIPAGDYADEVVK